MTISRKLIAGFEPHELRAFAIQLAFDHDPANQEHNYERCELCGFTRHPCDTHDLAAAVIVLLDER